MLFFIASLESTLTLENFRKKTVSLIAWVFLKLLTLKDVVTYTDEKFFFCFCLGPYHSERVNGFEKLLKSGKKNFHTFLL